MEDPPGRDLIAKVTSPQPCHVPLLRSKLSRGEGSQGHKYQEAGTTEVLLGAATVDM